jgi:hypothetical protein
MLELATNIIEIVDAITKEQDNNYMTKMKKDIKSPENIPVRHSTNAKAFHKNQARCADKLNKVLAERKVNYQLETME